MASSTRSITSNHLCGLMQALSHKHRLSIVDCLQKGEMDVQSIQEALTLGQSTVSQHLAVMRTQKIVKERRAGRRVTGRRDAASLPIVRRAARRDRPVPRARAAMNRFVP